MHRKAIWLTRTAAMLALLICLQWAGSMIPHALTKQLITGTMVNCVLAVTVLTVGYRSGISVALISPVCAFWVGISQLITVLPIMLGNLVFVLLLGRLMGKALWQKVVALGAAAAAKFAVLYILVVKIICGLALDVFLGKKVGDTILLGPKMPGMFSLMFSWPQLVTAVAGGILALIILPVLKKAIKD